MFVNLFNAASIAVSLYEKESWLPFDCIKFNADERIHVRGKERESERDRERDGAKERASKREEREREREKTCEFFVFKCTQNESK